MSTANIEILRLPSYLGGDAISSVDTLTVHYPYDGSIAGTVSKINGDHLDPVIDRTLSFDGQSSRFDRSQVLTRARELLLERAGEFANLIRMESGLCMRETKYEVGRACDVFQFAAAEALKDDAIAVANDSKFGLSSGVAAKRTGMRPSHSNGDGQYQSSSRVSH